jgi:hypothetical protein
LTKSTLENSDRKEPRLEPDQHKQLEVQQKVNPVVNPSSVDGGTAVIDQQVLVSPLN